MTQKDILLKLEIIEKKMLKTEERNNKAEQEIQTIFHYLKQLLESPKKERNQIGYRNGN